MQVIERGESQRRRRMTSELESASQAEALQVSAVELASADWARPRRMRFDAPPLKTPFKQLAHCFRQEHTRSTGTLEPLETINHDIRHEKPIPTNMVALPARFVIH
jgi:hypothetical protein